MLFGDELKFEKVGVEVGKNGIYRSNDKAANKVEDEVVDIGAVRVDFEPNPEKAINGNEDDDRVPAEDFVVEVGVFEQTFGFRTHFLLCLNLHVKRYDSTRHQAKSYRFYRSKHQKYQCTRYHNQQLCRTLVVLQKILKKTLRHHSCP